MTPQRGDIPAETLLGRPEFSGDLNALAAQLAGKRVLITGAAGSVGWPLSHLLNRVKPGAILLLDHHEHSLFALERSLGPGGGGAAFELLDVRSERRLRRTFERFRPQVLFHLAAAKHVPYGERYPDGVIEANVLATACLLQLAEQVGTEVVVYPSSDKSVDPPSLYGATKRLCEGLVQVNASDGRRWAVARFVNIIGTRGSVIESFTQQTLADVPLTVTDERMTRYWISMNEALWLLLAAATAGHSGQVLMPACGEAVPVMETARRLAAWYRPERDPYPLSMSGIRPGERLHEVLLSRNEAMIPGPLPGVHFVQSRRKPPSLDVVRPTVARLRTLVEDGDGKALRDAAFAAAETLQ